MFSFFTFLWWRNSNSPPSPPETYRQKTPDVKISAPADEPPQKNKALNTSPLTPTAAARPPAVKVPSSARDNPNQHVVRYTVDDGLAVIQGDIVIGVPPANGPPESGEALAPIIQLWGTRAIPYHIQPDFVEPLRIQQALELFNSSLVRFIPYSGQKDVLVFENGSGVCKSYVGKIGGLQPIWLPPDCSATEVAHEIMHALGFVHEQNRIDRDQFIELINDNIDERYKINFEILPEPFMILTTTAGFDFESLMLYPPLLFSRNGQPTMIARNPDVRLSPSHQLSQKDVQRLNLYFSNKD